MPGGKVVVNLPGIEDPRELEVLESQAYKAVVDELPDLLTTETRFSARLICDIHRRFLGQIYPWAGNYRRVNLTKGGMDCGELGFVEPMTWPPFGMVPENIAKYEAKVLTRLTPCRPAAPATVARAMAEVHAELQWVHPFRDGNGRTGRLVAAAMAWQAGLPSPVWDESEAGRCRHLLALVGTVGGGYDRLSEVVLEALERAGGAF